MKKFLSRSLVLAVILAIAGLALAPVTYATSNAPFISEQSNNDSTSLISFGENSLLAGSSITDDTVTQGLGLAAGNHLVSHSVSEYGFAAANLLEYSGQTEKDFFAAGNIIELKSDAKIGRDAFLAGKEVIIHCNLSGNLAIAASKVTFENVTILGDVNLNVSELVVGEGVKIAGILEYNDDAITTGLDQATIGRTKLYTQESATSATAQDFWLQTGLNIVGGFITALLLIIIFPGLKTRLDAEATVQRFGVDLIAGLVFLIAGPLLSLLLIITLFGMQAGFIVLGAWILILCLASIMTGIWLGHLLCEKLFHFHLPVVLEALTGILALTILTLLPSLGTFISFLATILGSGLIISCVRPAKPALADLATSTQDIVNPFRGQSGKNTPKTTKVVKATKSTKSKTTKPAKTTTKKSSH